MANKPTNEASNQPSQATSCGSYPATVCSARPEGWKPLMNSQKWHYFREGRSLCRKWMCLGDGELDPRTMKSPDNCAECYRRRMAEISSRQNTTALETVHKTTEE